MFVCPVPKISQVMMKSRRRASHRGRFKCAWHNGRRPTTQLGRFPLCGTTAAELRNSVDLLCGTTAVDLCNSVDLLCGATAAGLNNPMHAPAVAHIFKGQLKGNS